MQFIDDRRLGPGFRFFNRHRMVDEKGKVLGYKNLDELRESLAAGAAAPHARIGAAGVAASGPRRSFAFRRAASRRNCTTPTCSTVAQIVRKKYPHRDGPAAAANVAA